MSHYMVWPLSADVPEAGSSGQNLLPLGVPPHHHPTVLLAQQTLQLRVDSILTRRNIRSIRSEQKDNTGKHERIEKAHIYSYD